MKEKTYAISIGSGGVEFVTAVTELDAIMRALVQIGVTVEELDQPDEKGAVKVVKKTTYKAEKN